MNIISLYCHFKTKIKQLLKTIDLDFNNVLVNVKINIMLEVFQIKIILN